MILLFDPATPYELVIKLMDATREAVTKENGIPATKRLFRSSRSARTRRRGSPFRGTRPKGGSGETEGIKNNHAGITHKKKGAGKSLRRGLSEPCLAHGHVHHNPHIPYAFFLGKRRNGYDNERIPPPCLYRDRGREARLLVQITAKDIVVEGERVAGTDSAAAEGLMIEPLYLRLKKEAEKTLFIAGVNPSLELSRRS